MEAGLPARRSASRQTLNAMAFGFEDRAAPIDEDIVGLIELADGGTEYAPTGEELPVVGKLLDASVQRVRDEDIPGAIDADTEGCVELAQSLAFCTVDRLQCPVGRQLHRAAVEGIGDIDVSGAVHGDTFWLAQIGRVAQSADLQQRLARDRKSTR